MVYKFELWLAQTLSLNYNHLKILLTYNYTILFLVEERNNRNKRKIMRVNILTSYSGN